MSSQGPTQRGLAGNLARVDLKTYAAELPLGTLTVGVDNIHHDVYLSPAWTEQTRTYLLEFVRQVANLNYSAPKGPKAPKGSKGPKGPETGAWKRQTLELLQASLTRAKYEKKVELDLLLRVSVLKFLTQEIAAQFAHSLLEAKEWIRTRGEYFERSEQAHVMKARLAELQAGRRAILRQVTQHVYQILLEFEENNLGRWRKALFGDEQSAAYEMLNDRIAFIEGGRDDLIFLEQYVLLGNYLKDEDRFETFDSLMLDFLRETVLTSGSAEEIKGASRSYRELVDSAVATREELARLEGERNTLSRKLEKGGGMFARVGIGPDISQVRAELSKVEYSLKQAQAKLDASEPQIEAAKNKSDFIAQEYDRVLGDYLNEPENARRLFDADWPEDTEAAGERGRRLDDWLVRLEKRDLLIHVLASYEVRNIYHDYCPPIHLQQLKKALVSREEFEHVEQILKQFPARRFSMERIEALAKKVRRYPRDEARMVALRFAEDFMRLRRDLRNYERLSAAMERIQLVRSEKTREISRMNNSLYEFLLPTETPPAHDQVVNHAVIKADVRGSTRITKDLLARGLNPATLFSLNFYEPVKRILDRYGAAKVFIEGDAMVLAIFETESNRANQRAVSKACALARQILAISAAYNERPEAGDLPRLELGIGIAFQGSAPTYWVDSDSRIMISRALNLSDRLSSCSKVARRMLGDHSSLFRLFVFQPGMEGAQEDEADEFLIRFNLNGVELNDEGFAKLSEEIALQSVEVECEMPWGQELTTFFVGQAPIGDAVEPILLRRGYVRQLLSDGRIGPEGQRAYYEVCTDPRVLELVDAMVFATSRKN
jgi:class 3 adenylate cyclase